VGGPTEYLGGRLIIDPTVKWSSWTREKWGEMRFQAAIDEALNDEEIRAVPALVEALKNLDRDANPLMVDIVLIGLIQSISRSVT